MMKPIVIREVAALVLRPSPIISTAIDSDRKRKLEEQQQKKHDHARYYGIITLNQILLTRGEIEVAGKLIDCYFEIFSDLLARIEKAREAGKSGRASRKRKDAKKDQEAQASMKAQQEEESESKILTAVLTGVNRAYPYASLTTEA